MIANTSKKSNDSRSEASNYQKAIRKMNHPEFSEGNAVILMDKDIISMFGRLKCPFTGKAGKYD